MRQKSDWPRLTLYACILVFALFTINSSCENLTNDTIYDLNIEKADDGKWRVLDSLRNNRGELEVNGGNQISWEAVGSDMLFIFPGNMERYFEFQQGLFQETAEQVMERFPDSQLDTLESFNQRRFQFVREDSTLSISVKLNAPDGKVRYPVFITVADTFVVGNSPPIVIIQ